MLDRLKQYGNILSPAGTAELIATVQAYKERYAENWLAEYKAANPEITELVDLVANYEFPQAWEQMVVLVNGWIDTEENWALRIGYRTSADVFLQKFKPDAERMHQQLRAEIDRPRF